MRRSPQSITRTEVLVFLREKHTAVLATVDEYVRPHTAAITYLAAGNFTFYFITKRTKRSSRKALNISLHREVSLTVFDDGALSVSVQLEGEAEFVNDPKKRIAVQRRIINKVWRKSPFVPPVIKMPGFDTVLIRVRADRLQWFRDDGYGPIRFKHLTISLPRQGAQY